MSVPDATTIEPPRVIPPHYFLLAIASMFVIAWLHQGQPLLGAPWRWLGAVLLIAGIVVAVVARRQFALAGTEVRPLHKSSALVTDGMFRFSRNPMYTAMFAALIGIALMLDRDGPWLVVPLFMALIYYRFVRHEEAFMAEQFGQVYLDYKARVRRWL